jgi:hypothetical protein
VPVPGHSFSSCETRSRKTIISPHQGMGRDGKNLDTTLEKCCEILGKNLNTTAGVVVVEEGLI